MKFESPTCACGCDGSVQVRCARCGHMTTHGSLILLDDDDKCPSCDQADWEQFGVLVATAAPKLLPGDRVKGSDGGKPLLGTVSPSDPTFCVGDEVLVKWDIEHYDRHSGGHIVSSKLLTLVSTRRRTKRALHGRVSVVDRGNAGWVAQWTPDVPAGPQQDIHRRPGDGYADHRVGLTREGALTRLVEAIVKRMKAEDPPPPSHTPTR